MAQRKLKKEVAEFLSLQNNEGYIVSKPDEFGMVLFESEKDEQPIKIHQQWLESDDEVA